MLFRVDEMKVSRSTKKSRGYIEFRMNEYHVVFDKKNHRNQELSGYAFRVYDSLEMKHFLKLWLDSIDRACEFEFYHSGEMVATNYTSFVQRYNEPFTFLANELEHGKIYEFV